MRFPALLTLTLLATAVTSGCAAPSQTPLAQNQARVELSTQRPSDRISAYRLDGDLVRALRFPDLEPGRHELQVRFHYEVPGSASSTGQMGEAQWRSCILGISHAEFTAGSQYRVVADRRGLRPAAWLETADGQRLANAEVVRCGPGA